MKRVDMICPNCKNENYVVDLSSFSKAFKYKCMNCNQYFNENDPSAYDSGYVKGYHDALMIQPEIVRCIDCKWQKWVDIDDEVVFCKWHNDAHSMDWYCADGRKKDG